MLIEFRPIAGAGKPPEAVMLKGCRGIRPVLLIAALIGVGVTVSVTAALVTLPAELETTTVNCAPLSESWVAEVE
jgi:hypothetical protein